jgi:hypothetical protein
MIKVDMAMRTLTSTEVKVKSYKIHLMEMVINAIYYNPVCELTPDLDIPNPLKLTFERP